MKPDTVHDQGFRKVKFQAAEGFCGFKNSHDLPPDVADGWIHRPMQAAVQNITAVVGTILQIAVLNGLLFAQPGRFFALNNRIEWVSALGEQIARKQEAN